MYKKDLQSARTAFYVLFVEEDKNKPRLQLSSAARMTHSSVEPSVPVTL